MVPAAAASTMAMIVRRVRIVLRSFGWWSWRLNSLSNLNSLAPEVRPVVATVVAGEISFRRLGSQRYGQTAPVDRVLGPAGSPSPVPRGRNVPQACRLDRLMPSDVGVRIHLEDRPSEPIEDAGTLKRLFG